VLRPAHIGGYEKSFVLSEERGSPVGIEGVRGIHEAVRHRPAAGQEKRADFLLAIARFDSHAGGDPIAGAALNRAEISADGASNQETIIGISVELLAVRKEMIWIEVFEQALGANRFDAQIHVRQEGQPRKIYTRVPHGPTSGLGSSSEWASA
jgi:hypothetical protein